jgi:CRISPR/Cas system-associated protein Csx1
MHESQQTLVKPVWDSPIQAFYSDRIQLFDLMEDLLTMLDKKCRAIYITSFSASEEFIRKIFRFRQEASIEYMALFLDSRAALKMTSLLPFARNVFNDVYLTNNHGKVVLFDAKRKISVCTSQNQTRGNRREATLITTDEDCYQTFLAEIQCMINNGVKL